MYEGSVVLQKADGADFFLKVTSLQATSLVWLDCIALGRTADELTHQLLAEYKLWINPAPYMELRVRVL
ncbi:hypothetical protein [Flavobacterium sp. CF108]|uniref:hypothetical protein n=1 Tax=Flavobacterium sp. CF108 TaxID=1882758 RepID=UPI000936FE66|nr:hypothetical protein [Flavobacterium sp. CF108]